MFTDGRLHVVEMPILPKMIYRLMAIPLRIPPGFFAEMDKRIQNLYGRSRDPGQRRPNLVHVVWPGPAAGTDTCQG